MARADRTLPRVPLHRSGAGAVVLVGLLILAACAPSQTPRGDDAAPAVSIVASTNVYGDIAAQVGGRIARVTSIIDNPAADPHSYQATTRDLLAVSRADIVIENGGGYDDFMKPLVDVARKRSSNVLNAVDISGHRPDEHGELNEHVWYDIPTVIALTRRLVTALVSFDPGHAVDYRANARGFITRLAGLEARSASIRERHAGSPVAVTEPLPLYLLDACGLVDRTPIEFSHAVEEGEGVAPSVMADMIALVSDRRVDLMVENAQTTDAQTVEVSRAASAHGVPVVSVTETLPRGATYVSWMRSNLDAIRTALEHSDGT